MFQSLTSRYNTLRSNLLSSEADGDTEDDTHVCRVLRAYYTEKGRPFPPWLPPDPKAPPPPQFAVSSGHQSGQQQTGRGRGLSDLWGDSSQPAQQQEPPSLRRTAPGQAANRLQTRPGIIDSYNTQDQGQGRPLPSQKAGSYQSQFARDRSPVETNPSSGSGGTAQERLKARLWGSGRSSSPTSNVTSPVGSITSPDARSPSDRFNSRSPVGGDQSGYGRDSYGRRGGQAPVSANAPWSSGGGDAYNSNTGTGRLGRERIGLPSGPRPR